MIQPSCSFSSSTVVTVRSPRVTITDTRSGSQSPGTRTIRSPFRRPCRERNARVTDTGSPCSRGIPMMSCSGCSSPHESSICGLGSVLGLRPGFSWRASENSQPDVETTATRTRTAASERHIRRSVTLRLAFRNGGQALPLPRYDMRMRGLEPPRACAHTDLNRARLPIPPHPRG
jgi:hypothetical protein